MAREPIDSGEVAFQSEGRLLQELGRASCRELRGRYRRAYQECL